MHIIMDVSYTSNQTLLHSSYIVRKVFLVRSYTMAPQVQQDKADNKKSGTAVSFWFSARRDRKASVN